MAKKVLKWVKWGPYKRLIISPHMYKVINLPCEIDRLIVPMVLYFNSFRGIRCLYSCEGGHQCPYIKFRFTNKNSLKKLKKIFKNHIWEKDDEHNCMCIRWHNKKFLKEDIKRIV